MLIILSHCQLLTEKNNYLYDVDNVIGQPEYCKGTDDHQDEAAALSFALEPGVFQTADDGRVAGVDEAERHQAAHDGLKQVLEDSVRHAVPVVGGAEVQSDVVGWYLLQAAVQEGGENSYKGKYIECK